MTDHTATVLEMAASFGSMFLVIFGGIIMIYTRLARIETKLEPLWREFTKERVEQ